MAEVGSILRGRQKGEAEDGEELAFGGEPAGGENDGLGYIECPRLVALDRAEVESEGVGRPVLRQGEGRAPGGELRADHGTDTPVT